MRLFTCWYLLAVFISIFNGLLLFETADRFNRYQRLSETCHSDAITSIFGFLSYVDVVVREARTKVRNYREFKPMDCTEVDKMDAHDGIYHIWPRNRIVKGPVEVVCDLEDDGGGWTVIQRRGNYRRSSREYFFRDWDNYKTGFGNITKDFWIGNDIIYALTNQKAQEIKVVMSDWEGNTTYATYEDFWTSDELHNYTLHVEGYNGTAGDSLSYHSGYGFSTKDRDHDDAEKNCAEGFKAGWWFGKCYDSNLNGPYMRVADNSTTEKGIVWSTFRGHWYSLKEAHMKIRPRNYARRSILCPYED